MKCPECSRKLSTKNYDAAYEWYECPKCEGCFTYDEVLEGGISEDDDGVHNGNSAEGATNNRQRATKNGTPIAKGKKRRAEIEEDEQAVEEFTKQIVTNAVKQASPTKHRDEVETVAVVNVWGDEIQDVYRDLGSEIDEMNAQDKALIIWREIHNLQGVTARDQEVAHALCKEHS
jgi:hypothetical protein